MELYYIAIAFIIDLIIGDPYFLPHPIVLIGKFISFMEKLLRKFSTNPKALKGIAYNYSDVFRIYCSSTSIYAKTIW
jgi:adenosylcobinamide-phosphate synthase